MTCQQHLPCQTRPLCSGKACEERRAEPPACTPRTMTGSMHAYASARPCCRLSSLRTGRASSHVGREGSCAAHRDRRRGRRRQSRGRHGRRRGHRNRRRGRQSRDRRRQSRGRRRAGALCRALQHARHTRPYSLPVRARTDKTAHIAFYCIYVLASRYAHADLSLRPTVSVLASNFKSRSMTLVDAKTAPATQSWRLFDLSCRQRGKGHTTPAVTHPRRSDGETRWAPATQSSGTLAALGAAAHAAVQEQTRVQAEATGRREVAPCAQTRTWDKCAGAHWPRE
jgi:hypothetical protein